MKMQPGTWFLRRIGLPPYVANAIIDRPCNDSREKRKIPALAGQKVIKQVIKCVVRRRAAEKGKS
jgi:hypothetical protein